MHFTPSDLKKRIDRIKNELIPEWVDKIAVEHLTNLDSNSDAFEKTKTRIINMTCLALPEDEFIEDESSSKNWSPIGLRYLHKYTMSFPSPSLLLSRIVLLCKIENMSFKITQIENRVQDKNLILNIVKFLKQYDIRIDSDAVLELLSRAGPMDLTPCLHAVERVSEEIETRNFPELRSFLDALLELNEVIEKIDSIQDSITILTAVNELENEIRYKPPGESLLDKRNGQVDP